MLKYLKIKREPFVTDSDFNIYFQFYIKQIEHQISGFHKVEQFINGSVGDFKKKMGSWKNQKNI